MPEAMPKMIPIANYHSRYSDFFQNLHDGGGLAMDVVTMGEPVERPIPIRTLTLVLVFILTHAPYAVSLQDAMAIILKRSQCETFSAPMGYLYQEGQDTRHNLGSYGGLCIIHNFGIKKEYTAG
jgi:hypothetical protein